MAYYQRDEQETIYNYDPIDGLWRIYSTYPPHIRRIIERGEDINEYKDGEGRVIEVTGTLEPHQIRLYR